MSQDKTLLTEYKSINEDSRPIYERLTDESSIWFARFLIFRNQNPASRSLLAAVHTYQQQAAKSPYKPCRTVPGAWKDAVERFDWKFRASLYDEEMQRQADERARVLAELEQQEIERILTTDYAAMHHRVKALAAMAHTIEKSFIDEDSQEVNYKFMSPDKLREWRGCLDDIAKELGQRVVKKESKIEGALHIVTEWGGGVLADEGAA